MYAKINYQFVQSQYSMKLLTGLGIGLVYRGLLLYV